MDPELGIMGNSLLVRGVTPEVERQVKDGIITIAITTIIITDNITSTITTTIIITDDIIITITIIIIIDLYVYDVSVIVLKN